MSTFTRVQLAQILGLQPHALANRAAYQTGPRYVLDPCHRAIYRESDVDAWISTLPANHPYRLRWINR